MASQWKHLTAPFEVRMGGLPSRWFWVQLRNFSGSNNVARRTEKSACVFRDLNRKAVIERGVDTNAHQDQMTD